MMTLRKKAAWFAPIFAVLLATTLTSCSKNKSTDSAAGADEVGGVGDSDSGSAQGLQTVNFAYDSYVLGSEAKSILDSNVDILKDKANLRIQIEGHCDERGSIQYNLALGEKRAKAVRNYLRGKGISGNRVSTISFGEERPIDSGSDESAWAKNRRANFVIVST